MRWARAVEGALEALARIWSRRSNRPPHSRFKRVRPPHRRRVLFEMLEPRLLLSADPAIVVTGNALDAQLTDGADQLAVTRLGTASDGGSIVNLSLGAWSQDYGSADAGIASITLDGGGGDDSLQIIDLTSTDTAWLIDGQDSGSVGNVHFSGIEHLVGAADNADTFTFTSSGRLSGGLDGGAGGQDALVVDGAGFTTVSSTARSADAGVLSFDATVLQYAGLEPITITGVPDVVLHGTGGDDQLVLE